MKDFLKRVSILLASMILFPVIAITFVLDAFMMPLYYLYKGKFLWDDYNALFIVFLELVYEGKCEWKREEQQ